MTAGNEPYGAKGRAAQGSAPENFVFVFEDDADKIERRIFGVLGVFRFRTSSPKNEEKGAAGLRGGREWCFSEREGGLG